MMSFPRFSLHARRLALRLGLASLLLSGGVLADAPQDRKVFHYNVAVSGGKNAGGARALVNASDSVMRSVVTDFERYEEFIKRFSSAKIVGKVGDKTDVYLKVPILQGSLKIWAIVRFEPPKREGNTEIIVGKMVKGNVKRLDATWRIRRVSDKNSELTLELAIVPDLPVPDSLVLPELRHAADKAVKGARAEAERRATSS